MADAETFYCDQHGWVALVGSLGIFRVATDDCAECDDTLRRLERLVAA